jgi:hypothetical protein
MKTYFDIQPFTHYIPLNGHNVTLKTSLTCEAFNPGVRSVLRYQT